MKSVSRFAMVAALGAALVGCGQRVEVPPGHVAKTMGTEGYYSGVIPTSKFRLPKCWSYCDKLVLLEVADRQVREQINLFMPKDKLKMAVSVQLTLSVNPQSYEYIFANVTPSGADDSVDSIPVGKVYQTYAQQVILSKTAEILSKYTIAEVASSRELINEELRKNLTDTLAAKTPFSVRAASLVDVAYPDVITQAQENAAERREKIQQEEAQLEISKVALERELQEQQLRRKIDVEKAQAEAEVNRIVADSMTPAYKSYRALQIMEKLAESDNKVFVPTEMLDSMAAQVQLGRQ